MRILLTNTSLHHRGGSEMYIHDIALKLLQRGHTPIVYSPRLGPVSEKLRLATIPTIDNLSLLGEPPDIIHGHHHLETMAAVTRFPTVPAVYFCHGWLPWEEAPVQFPTIQRYIAVSETTRERLISEGGIPAALITTLPNFVDLDRFQTRPPLPSKPQYALVLSNQLAEHNLLPLIRHACQRHDIALDVVGLASGHPVDQPENVLPRYDLVFARGRSALEGLAVGTAVILCDLEGLGPMVTSKNFEQLRQHNMGLRALTTPLDEDHLYREIAKYDANDAQVVCQQARATSGIDAATDRLCQIYQEVIDAFVPMQDPSAAFFAFSRYCTWLSRTIVQNLLLGNNQLLQDREAYYIKSEELAASNVQSQRAYASLEERFHQSQRAYVSLEDRLHQSQSAYAALEDRFQMTLYENKVMQKTIAWRLHNTVASHKWVSAIYLFFKRLSSRILRKR